MPELPDVDPAAADPAYRNAPLTVRRASAWIETHGKAATPGQRLAPFVPVGGLFASFALAAALASTFGEPAGIAAVLGGFAFLGGGAWWLLRSPWHQTNTWAQTTLAKWSELDRLGLSADLTPAVDSPTDLRHLVDRIGALAGDGPLRDAAVQALGRAQRLNDERSHLERMATGQPDADAALDAARERIETEIARIRARLAEAYARLVERETAAETGLDDALDRLVAELEVDRAVDRRRQAPRVRA